ncbi:excalibur calcium-binding domain-containing protein [Shewanella litorisediminis]|uniref:Excalibur calcium-binding domain-containing protein n=1 Tax=Shewanella litorisediminis TaxID=1173586 RepID=A0ABX7G216_9GAMM|nr:excalibur calcium-binding domain-containing protein [Shewanella litorisediminis]MCL2918494.1 excalibur calcium-binding domain-containing protein [Shewanella litorisediminis]QRH01326.1 excalibur calcium-binding domain-containing protein [Shewanella litorisediminis]
MQRGKLVRWNDERGFGFIKPELDGTGDVFIHISSLKQMSRAPRVGDIIVFQLETSSDGKQQAGIARIEGVAIKPASPIKARKSATTFPLGKLLKGVVLIALIAFAVPKLAPLVEGFTSQDTHYSLPPMETEAIVPERYPEPVFRCEGKTHCSEMRSCAEATFYQNNCPGTKMDGDNDGIPCESQWCGH